LSHILHAKFYWVVCSAMNNRSSYCEFGTRRRGYYPHSGLVFASAAPTCGGDESVADDVGFVGDQNDGVESLGRAQLLQTGLRVAERRPVGDRVDD